MITKLFKLCFLLSLIVLFVAGCEKNPVTPSFNVSTESNAKLLLYLEEQGDVINNIHLPVVPAYEVFNNLNNYLVVDIRDSSSFFQGHISGAKNIRQDSLLNYIKRNYALFSKVVLVSASGQSAAYCSALLQLAGLSNIYYMNYGMASWNPFFSSVWSDRLDTHKIDVSHFMYPKGPYTPLPEISFSQSGQSMSDFVQQKINSLLKEGFNEDFNSVITKASMTFNTWIHDSSSYYLICTGPIQLYASNPYTTNTYHPLNAVFYAVPPDPSDFRSITFLQTLPSAGNIAIYSGTGQESAFYTAYLRLLGYNARSVLFGMNNMMFDMLLHMPETQIFFFTYSYIMIYPYITGNARK
jgi:rhodanese-related sulfurtransferase